MWFLDEDCVRLVEQNVLEESHPHRARRIRTVSSLEEVSREVVLRDMTPEDPSWAAHVHKLTELHRDIASGVVPPEEAKVRLA